MTPRDVEAADQAGEVERLRFRTETGSVYELTRDGADMRWTRTPTMASGVLGVERGPLAAWPAVMPGYRAALMCEPDDESGLIRVITSRVVEILEGRRAEPLDLSGDARALVAGDVLMRDLGGVLVALPYLGARDGLIHAGFGPALCWTFDEATGAEVDDEIGWGPAHGVTGSCLVGVRRGVLARHDVDEIVAVWARMVAGANNGSGG